MVLFATPDFGAEAYATMLLFLIMVAAAGLVTLISACLTCSARDLGWTWWGRGVLAALGSVGMSVVLFFATARLVDLFAMPLLGLLVGVAGGLVFRFFAQDVPEWAHGVLEWQNPAASGRPPEGIKVAGLDQPKTGGSPGLCRKDDIVRG
jgi:hypothetical protein